jgi:probable F420-dependent oxidoreductase
MHFGAMLHPFSSFEDLPALVAFAQRAEHEGFSYLSIPDHTLFPMAEEPLMGKTYYDAVVLATHLADRTTTIRLAFQILVLPQWHPIHLAKQLATLDLISGGRVDVGLGVGWLKGEFDMLGAEFKTRGRRMDEYIEIMKAIWTTHPTEFHGEWFDFADASGLPKPVQSPHPPILIGGTWGPSARRAARLGDGWMVLDIPEDEFDEAMTLLRTERELAGRSMDGFQIYGRVPLFAHNAASREHAEIAGAAGIGLLDGDYGKAVEYVQRAEAQGYTHMFVELPAATQIDELEPFRRNVIDKL